MSAVKLENHRAGGTAAVAFQAAYAAWMQARSEIATMEAAAAGEDDEVLLAAINRVIAAEWKLAGTPPVLAHQLIIKFEVLEHMLSIGERDGYPTDHRHMLMAAAFKADLYRFKTDIRPAEPFGPTSQSS